MSLRLRVVLPEFHERPETYFQSFDQRSRLRQKLACYGLRDLRLVVTHSRSFKVGGKPALSPRHNELRPDLFEKILVLAGEAVQALTWIVKNLPTVLL